MTTDRDRAEAIAPLIGNYIKNKPWARPDASNYQTVLSPADEQTFRAWVAQNNIPFDPNETIQDYDMRGFWRGVQTKNPIATNAIDPNDNRLHYPDYWKTPYHQTFSNESQWALPNAPKWNDKDQLIGSDGTVIFDDRASRSSQ